MLALSFERSVVLAFAAAVGAGICGTVGAASWLGFYLEPALFWASVAAYLWGAKGLRWGLLVLVLSGVSLLLLYQLALDPLYGRVGAALCLGILRGQLSPQAPRSRRLAVELGLGAVALAGAHFLDDGSAFGLALGMWGFWLSHCAYPLLAEARPESEESSRDAFEVAQNRARRVLAEIQGDRVSR
jgi:hypothetical protein